MNLFLEAPNLHFAAQRVANLQFLEDWSEMRLVRDDLVLDPAKDQNDVISKANMFGSDESLRFWALFSDEENEFPNIVV